MPPIPDAAVPGGVNRVEPVELTLALEEPRPDGFLLAGRYTLLDHGHALQRLLTRRRPPLAHNRDAPLPAGT